MLIAQYCLFQRCAGLHSCGRGPRLETAGPQHEHGVEIPWLQPLPLLPQSVVL